MQASLIGLKEGGMSGRSTQSPNPESLTLPLFHGHFLLFIDHLSVLFTLKYFKCVPIILKNASWSPSYHSTSSFLPFITLFLNIICSLSVTFTHWFCVCKTKSVFSSSNNGFHSAIVFLISLWLSLFLPICFCISPCCLFIPSHSLLIIFPFCFIEPIFLYTLEECQFSLKETPSGFVKELSCKPITSHYFSLLLSLF